MKKITERCPDFKSIEKEIFGLMCQTARELTQQYLEWLDKSMMTERDTAEYRCIDIRTTTVKTVYGEVSYSRRYYKKKDGRYIFLLDTAMGIETGFGLVSENLAEQIVIECSEKSYRKSANSISSLTDQRISAMGAWNIVQRYGESIENQEARLAKLGESGLEGQLGNIPSRVLFEELDDVWLSMQKENRHKHGASGSVRKKTGKKPLHVGVAYTGWSRTGDGKYNTANKIAYGSFDDVKVFTSKFETLLRHCFDMDGIEYRITNGDGDPWIRKAAEENDSILQLDPYHRSRAIIKAAVDKSDRKALFDAIGEKDTDKVLHIIRRLADTAQDEPERKKLGKLYEYFSSNKDSFLTWQERGIALPAPPEGISYRNLGVQESSNCNLITQRMKHRKGSWSVTGAGHMAKVLCFRYTIGLDRILGVLPEASPSIAHAEPLSAAKVPKYDGNGYGADWLYAGMPFEQAFKTNGREAVKGMLRQRPVSGLAFL
jgi:hypothetical protein